MELLESSPENSTLELVDASSESGGDSGNLESSLSHNSIASASNSKPLEREGERHRERGRQ